MSTISLFNKHVNKETGLFDLQSFNHAVIELKEQYKQVKVEPEVKPACGMCCLDCKSYEMIKDKHTENFCSQWCIVLDKLYGWNITKDSCNKFVSKSV